MKPRHSYYTVECRVGEARAWDGGWFQFHAGPNRRKAQKFFARAKVAYAHWPRLSVRLRRWVRPSVAGVSGWMSERRP